MTTETPVWFTSSYSNNGGECVEVAINLVASHGTVPVRDTKLQESPVLTVPAASFSALVAGIKAGGFPA
ncbi:MULTISPECIES: DUF397 domain-containing protein [Streptomyces]|uniref:DUF397 domain-containing protein n=1 Tax=Streptomyces fungicidicus TaxID=68203 RepID=A0ACC7Y763_9ACTN|nr:MULTISPECIES: DUF397 domain-containing protein [Streptomyces]MBF4134875.1 DUF397 domain-containing protein [Streptomyces albidoflavus]NUV77663.1 DUF397 domain-containing protein [Streptomyces fungicidicus]